MPHWTDNVQVQLPIQSFLGRISRVANETNTACLRQLPGSATEQDKLMVQLLLASSFTVPSTCLRHCSIACYVNIWSQAIHAYLFDTLGYGLPSFGRSNVPSGVIMENPGWQLLPLYKRTQHPAGPQ